MTRGSGVVFPGPLADAGSPLVFLRLLLYKPFVAAEWVVANASPTGTVAVSTQNATQHGVDVLSSAATETPAKAPQAGLAWPATTVEPVRIRWRYAIGIPLVHVLACLAFIPWLFSWSGVISVVVGLYVFGTLGINLCYHRMLTHQGLVAPKLLEHGLALLGVCALQDTPACWVAMHRLHHKHSDERPDPHSPLVNFLWGHCGWLMIQNRQFSNLNHYQRYARDVLRDPFYLRLERNATWLWVYIASGIVFFGIGAMIGWLTGRTAMAAVQGGASLVVWGVFVRTVVTWHITWSVNSLGHVFGYRNYETDDNSRNNVLVGLLSNGEGWHNNHHADQRAAAHGHRWWELDVTWLTIRLLEKVGLVSEVVRPRLWTG